MASLWEIVKQVREKLVVWLNVRLFFAFVVMVTLVGTCLRFNPINAPVPSKVPGFSYLVCVPTFLHQHLFYKSINPCNGKMKPSTKICISLNGCLNLAPKVNQSNSRNKWMFACKKQNSFGLFANSTGVNLFYVTQHFRFYWGWVTVGLVYVCQPLTRLGQ